MPAGISGELILGEVSSIVFKCSFGGRDGWGHVIRCSALARHFLGLGWKTKLWSEGEVDFLPDEVGRSFSDLDPEGGSNSQILVIDEMYTDQSSLERIVALWRVSNPGSVVLGIDDMQNRSMKGFDLVLNTELGLRSSSYKTNQVLLGEAFALLRRGFSCPESKRGLDFGEDSLPVFVMLGGTDPFEFLPRVLSSLNNLDNNRIFPIVVTGQRQAELLGVLEKFADYRLVSGVGSAEIAGYLKACRLGIVACGTSLYELAAMGLPFVGLSLVDNQTATAHKVRELWKMPVLNCESGSLETESLLQAIKFLLEKPTERYSEVDTLGCSRVAEKLIRLCSF